MYLQSPPTDAAEFVFAEEGGIKLSLKDRFLPYRPIRIEGRQRAEFTWYPGSPEATVQMLGPEEGVIRLNGFWKDRFFEVKTSAFASYTSGAPPLDVKLIESVSDLVQAVDDMRRMGRRIKMSWSGLERVGHITSFTQTWHNIHDCEWEIEFSVLSQGEATVPSSSPASITLPDLYAQAIELAKTIQKSIYDAAHLSDFVSLTSKATAALNGVSLLAIATAGALQDVAQGYAGGIFSVTQGTRKAVSAISGAISGSIVTADSITEQAIGEFYSFNAWGDQDNTPPGVQVAAYGFQSTLARDRQRFRHSFAYARRQAAQQEAGQDSEVQVYTPKVGEDLRAVALRFYNTSDNWIPLMLYNNLASSQLKAGQQVNIPPVTSLTGQGKPS